ncbi:response regulator transcription factor [Spirosoma agri]|uniref:Response regulator transcription factor n=1 Tax=Spirosoma agri TaxID=1987381 RepID=A0A6M0IQM9_9BACT|nr:response regulator transcription factor [Spirosoma agri]NEU70252.1 response regulator transcription factor [Spirosoma agri]
MSTIRCILIDDEPMGLSVLQAHASKVPYLTVLATFASATEALVYLQTQPVDLLFLDIQMPDLSGLEMARLLDSSMPIIFTTAYRHYAVDGFDLAAIDYLLKPISLSRFLQACHRAADRLASLPSRKPATNDHLFVKTGYDWARIDLASLLYIEADDNYLTFYELDRRTLSRMKLSEAMDKLPADQFVRIHKSYVISLAKIDKIERHQVTLAGHSLPLSATFRQELLGRFS